MAFFRKAGNILGRVPSNHVSREIALPKPSIFQAIRSVFSSKSSIVGLNRTKINKVIESVKIKSAYQSASPIAQDMSVQLRTQKAGSLRAIFSRMVKNMPLAMKKRISGIRVCLSGRIKGAKIARTECAKYGKISRNVFDQKMDYALSEVSTRYGILGLKVWISYRQKRKGRALYENDA